MSAAATSPTCARSTRRPARAHRRPRTVLLAALALALSLTACGQAAAGAAPSTSPAAATATPLTALISGPALAWHTITLPESGQLAVAPTDGDVAYEFNYVGSVTHVWATRDRGAHWTRGGTLTVPTGTTGLFVAVDATDANTVVVTFDAAPIGASPQLNRESAAASTDGGASWQTLLGHQLLWQLATYHGAIYATREGVTSQGADQRNLWISDDGMRSWRVIGPPQTATNPSFLLDPRTGSLLATDTFTTPPTLMRSDDGGSHWRQVAVPPDTEALISTPDTTSTGGSPWLTCVAASVGPAPGGTNPRNRLACGTDDGQPWETRPALNLSQQSPKGFMFIAPMDVFALASDGSILATVQNINAAMTLYRLPAAATAWQILGPVSNFDSPTFCSGPGSGVLWEEGPSGTLTYLTAALP